MKFIIGLIALLMVNMHVFAQADARVPTEPWFQDKIFWLFGILLTLLIVARLLFLLFGKRPGK